jgi:predicted enzyme related to lactoylglutathione lyase
MARVVHFEIHCEDPDRAETFYRDVFGWEIQRYEDSPVDYRLITTGPDEEPGINGALVQRRGDVDGEAVTAYVCTVQVEDLQEVDDRAQAGGGRRVLDAMDVPGVGRLAYFKDTEGNIFGVLQPEEG